MELPMGHRRILTVALPHLFDELLRQQGHDDSQPWAAIIEDELQTQHIAAVNKKAADLGISPGQQIIEAKAYVANLEILSLPRHLLEQTLQSLCECLLEFSSSVACSLTRLNAPTETKRNSSFKPCIWIEITGRSHLFGGEALLCRQICTTLRTLGHRVRIATAPGPHLGFALAYWHPESSHETGYLCSDPITTADFRKLPIEALPLTESAKKRLTRLGFHSWHQLMRLPSKALALHLDSSAQHCLQLLSGRDDAPLQWHTPQPQLQERIDWDEPIAQYQPLLFALRGLSARMSRRLQGRGLAAQRLRITLHSDPAFCRFHNLEPVTTSELDLLAPLYQAADIWSVACARLEQTKLSAPCVGVTLTVPALCLPISHQLPLTSAFTKLKAGAAELSVLFGELTADIGAECFGKLQLVDTYCPEKQSQLVPFLETATSTQIPSTLRGTTFGSLMRLFTPALAIIGEFKKHSSVRIEERMFFVEALQFRHRLGSVLWWSNSISRDYADVILRSEKESFEGVAYEDKSTGKAYLHGIIR